MPMQIGTVADAAGVSVQTIRYYERIGVLPEPDRSSSGYRQYTPEAIHRLTFITRAQDLGFTLEEIRELLQLRVEEPGVCDTVKAKASLKIRTIQQKIRRLQKMEEALDTLVDSCEAKQTSAECPILEYLDPAFHEPFEEEIQI
ncbi:MAG TPA: heavy metal-responsive transcriptional regulator [bacterium]|nr:heavy metal-responsive transcriptional regulator [bacterium]